jgi:hypothetical protein
MRPFESSRERYPFTARHDFELDLDRSGIIEEPKVSQRWVRFVDLTPRQNPVLRTITLPLAMVAAIPFTLRRLIIRSTDKN